MSAGPILIVEDNATTRKMLRVALEVENYTVVEAEDGQSALALAREVRPALVLLDCRLHDMDGFEVARQLRESFPNLPLIAVTGWTQIDESRVLSSGFVDILTKPVEPHRLIELVNTYLHSNRQHESQSGQTALLIDDDPIQLKLAGLAFMHAGFRVEFAADGVEGLEKVRELRPDVVVSDVLMPRMDGFQLCDAIRRDPELCRIPVVLTSAHYVEDEDRALATGFGARTYVSRSVGFDHVVSSTIAALRETPRDVPVTSADALRVDYYRRISKQLERQAALNTGLVQRASVQATALSVLEGISDALAGQIDPESALEETLTQCLDAAGLSVGAILMRDSAGQLRLRARVGASSSPDLERYAPLFEISFACECLTIPSAPAGESGASLLQALKVNAAVVVPIVARDEALGALLLASNRPDFAADGGSSFVRAARSVSMQLGQALAVSRAFSRLAAAEQRYRALLENANDAIAILDPNGHVLEVNRRSESLFGVSRQQLMGRHLSDVFPSGEHAPEFFAALLRGGGSLSPVAVRRSGASDITHVEFSSTAIELAGEHVVLVIGRDVGERLRLAEQLRQAQKMEAIGRLAGGVAHDMNNVLAAVLAYAQFLLDSIERDDPRRGDADEIRRAAERGAALTRQLLAFSRQQSHRPRILDLNQVLNDLLKMLRSIIGEDVEMEARLTPGLPRVNVDASHIEQVVMNLVVNSRDAMPNGGRLSIGTSRRGDRVLLSVSDTGAGMSEEVLQHLFEPFFTTKDQGTGLGLATVFGIVKQSDGEIEVVSDLGRGTTFNVLLPQAESAKESSPPPTAERRTVGNETVLLIEDDDALRSALVRTLEAQGYCIFSCKTGAEGVALAEAQRSSIHLLVTDVVLPQQSGPDAAAEIRRHAPDAKVLFISGYTNTTAYRDVPVNGPTFLQKPFSPGTFAERVRTVLDGQEA